MFLKKKPHTTHENHSATPPDAAMPACDAPPPKGTPAAEGSPSAVEQVEAKAAEAEDWHTKYLYASAELDNFRKRTAKERRDLINYAGQEILLALIDVVDNFDRALEADRMESNPAVIIEGVELIRKQMGLLLDKFGVKQLNAMGAMFDPKVHEALQRMPAPDTPPGTVVHELQKGYVLRDRTLRPARVVVAAEQAEEKDLSDQSDRSDPSDTTD